MVVNGKYGKGIPSRSQIAHDLGVGSMGNLPVNHLRNDTFETQFAKVMGLSNHYLTTCLDAYRICKTCQIAMMSLYEGKTIIISKQSVFVPVGMKAPYC